MADDAIILSKRAEEDFALSVEEDVGLSLSFLRGSGTTVTSVNHDIIPGSERRDVHLYVPNDCATTFLEADTSSMHESRRLGQCGTDVDVSDRPAVNCSPERGEVEYEGEDEDERMMGRNTPPETRQCYSDHPVSDGASDLTLNRAYPVHTEVLYNDSATYYQDSANGTDEANMERHNSFTDLDFASGHVSDPGVCRTKELASMYSSSMVTQGGHFEEKFKNDEQSSKQVSVGASSESENGRLPDSLSAVSGHQIVLLSCDHSSIGAETKDLLSGVCVPSGESPRSEGAYQSTSSPTMFKVGAPSGAVGEQKRKPWWKMFLVSHRNIHREGNGGVLGSLSEGDAVRMSSVNGSVSDVEARSGQVSPPMIIVEGVSDSGKEQDNLRSLDNGVGPVRTLGFERKSLENLGTPEVLKCDISSETRALPHPCEVAGEYFKFSNTAKKLDSFACKTALSRVEEWVSNIHPMIPFLDDEQTQIEVDDNPESPTASAESFFAHFGRDSEDSAKVNGAGTRVDATIDADAEISNVVARSVNPISTVAHFSGVGLKVVPSLGMFGNLKTLNLSANSFVRITAGCLPKSLHSLDISRNSIHVIEGLRELTRLRILNLSFNRISRIGNGLSSCTSLKEVYLAGNKISEVEGLHRLSKLVVLDLSFNKLTTTKSLGQIAANYKSLQALNLLGNAVHSNLGDEQLRRFVTGICPQLAYLNKQALKTVSNREALGKELKLSGKIIAKPSKRGGGHQGVQSHRRTHSAVAGSVKNKAGGKGVTSPVLVGQGESHHRKAHHQSRSSSTKELPKGFVPLLPTANISYAEHGGRVSGRGESDAAVLRAKRDGVLFTNDFHWSSSTPRGVHAH